MILATRVVSSNTQLKTLEYERDDEGLDREYRDNKSVYGWHKDVRILTQACRGIDCLILEMEDRKSNMDESECP